MCLPEDDAGMVRAQFFACVTWCSCALVKYHILSFTLVIERELPMR
jgi:hypothetical protein